jgi:hypothetical protein
VNGEETVFPAPADVSGPEDVSANGDTVTAEQLPIVTPEAASPSFYLTVTCTYPAGATQIGQASTFTLVTPWGQSTPCYNLLDALNQMVAGGSVYSGQMWNYLNNGVTRGLTTTSATVPVSATLFQQPP